MWRQTVLIPTPTIALEGYAGHDQRQVIDGDEEIEWTSITCTARRAMKQMMLDMESSLGSCKEKRCCDQEACDFVLTASTDDDSGRLIRLALSYNLCLDSRQNRRRNLISESS